MMIENKSLQAVLDSLPQSCPESVDLSNKFFGDRGCQRLSLFFLHNLPLSHMIVSLDLRANNISSEGLDLIVPTLRQFSQLRFLNLEWNPLKASEGLRHLCEALSSNEWKVEELILRECQIEEAGATNIALMLRVNRHLRRLDLSHNAVRVDGGLILLDSLRDNPTLDQLNLMGNDVGYEITVAIDQLFQHPPADRCVADQRRRCEALEDELQRQREEARDSEKKYQTKLGTFQTELQTLQGEVQHLQEELQKSRSAFAKASEAFQLEKKISAKVERLQMREKELVKNISEKEKLEVHLRDRLSNKEKEVSEELHKCSELKGCMEELEKQVYQREREGETLTYQLQEKQKAYEEVSEKFEQMQKEKRQLEDRVATLEREGKQQLFTYESEKNELTQRCENFQRQWRFAQTEVAKGEELLKSKKAEHAKNLDEVQQAQACIAEELQHACNQVESFESDVKQLTSQKRLLKEEVTRKNEQLKTWHQKYENLAKHASETEGDFSRRLAEKEALLSEVQIQSTALQESSKSLEVLVEQKTAAVANYLQTIEQLKKNLHQRQQTTKQVEEQLRQRDQQLNEISTAAEKREMQMKEKVQQTYSQLKNAFESFAIA